MATPRDDSASAGSTISDPDLSQTPRKRKYEDVEDLPPQSSPPQERASTTPLAPPSSQFASRGQGIKKPRKSKGTPKKKGHKWIQVDGTDDDRAKSSKWTDDDRSVVSSTYRPGFNRKRSHSPRGSDAGLKQISATTVGTRRQANGTIGSVFSGNKIRHIKKEDGTPLTRIDIQYAFLKIVVEDKTPCFTKFRDGQKGCNFADIYIDAMAMSSKTSKVLKDKLQTDREAAENMAMICLLVNVGRMNTTLNFFPEMRAQLRTYHSIPSLQANKELKDYKSLQDAPRLKSILKGASEDVEQPRSVEAIREAAVPRTNPVNLIFVLSQFCPMISELHFFTSIDFFDLVIRPTLSSKTRARAFLWLMWWYLESNFTKEDALNNPFGPGQYTPAQDPDDSKEIPLKVPEIETLSVEDGNAENVDPPEELIFASKMQRERKRVLEEDGDPNNKLLRRVRRSAIDEDSIMSDADSINGLVSLDPTSVRNAARSPAGRASHTKDQLSPFGLDPSMSLGGGQADSLDEAWERVDPHPGRGRYKRPKSKKKIAEEARWRAERESSAAQTPGADSFPMTSLSGRPLIKSLRAQERWDPGTPENTTPVPPGGGNHVVLSQFGSGHQSRKNADAVLSRRQQQSYRMQDDGSNEAGGGGHFRRPRPLTQHQRKLENNRRERVAYIVRMRKKGVFEKFRVKRETGNYVLRAAQRIQALPPGYDSDDEDPEASWGIGGMVRNPVTSTGTDDDDDYGEEDDCWVKALAKAQKRLWKWSGNLPEAEVVLAGQEGTRPSTGRDEDALRAGGEEDGEETVDGIGSSPPPTVAAGLAGLSEIDRSLLAERSDGEADGDEDEMMADDDSDGAGGEATGVDTDVDMG